MGRILADLPRPCVEEPNAIADAEKLSRAEVIRRAVAAYVKQHRPATADAFGIRKQRGIDGLTYQEEARSEWQALFSLPIS